MQDIRTKIVNAVAVSVVIPLLIVNYLIMRWASHTIDDNPGTIVALVLLALVLIGGGVNIVRSISIAVPDGKSAAAPDAEGKSCCCPDEKK
jgi:uncharacterized membrane protein